MLVLSRNLDESIIINGNVKVKILEIRGNRVRLGIDAPREVTVDRQEIHEQKTKGVENNKQGNS